MFVSKELTLVLLAVYLIMLIYEVYWDLSCKIVEKNDATSGDPSDPQKTVGNTSRQEAITIFYVLIALHSLLAINIFCAYRDAYVEQVMTVISNAIQWHLMD